MKKLSIAIVVALACLTVGVVAASASLPKVKSTVTIHILRGTYSDDFFGKVKSDKAACERHRTVQVKKVVPGRNQVIGSDVTDKKGNWHVGPLAPVSPGQYYAKATKKVTSKFICHRAKSRKITVS